LQFARSEAIAQFQTSFFKVESSEIQILMEKNPTIYTHSQNLFALLRPLHPCLGSLFRFLLEKPSPRGEGVTA